MTEKDLSSISDDAIRVWYACLLCPIIPFESYPGRKFTRKAREAMRELVLRGYAIPVDEDGSLLGVIRYNPTEKTLIPEMRRRGMNLHLWQVQDRIQIFENVRKGDSGGDVQHSGR